MRAHGRNRILSYQFALLNGDSEAITKLIEYPNNGERMSLERGLTRVMLKARKERVIAKAPNRFIIAGHFTRADLTTFSDFGLFKRHAGAVRKTYVTTEIPLRLRLVSNEGPVTCHAVIIDTMLLAPVGTSLETLGKLLGVPKIELPEGYSKDKMDLFLQDHPALFEQYALTDAVIPALWVAKTYGLLTGSARHQEEGRHTWRRSGRDGEATGQEHTELNCTNFSDATKRKSSQWRSWQR